MGGDYIKFCCSIWCWEGVEGVLVFYLYGGWLEFFYVWWSGW